MVKARICALILFPVFLFSCATLREADNTLETAETGDFADTNSNPILPLPSATSEPLILDSFPIIDHRLLQKKIYPLIIADLTPMIRTAEAPILELTVSQESINPLSHSSETEISSDNRNNNSDENEYGYEEPRTEQMNTVLDGVEPEDVDSAPSVENDLMLSGLLNQEIILPGRNWIFIREAENKDVRLLGKDYRLGDTVFRFDFPFWGDFALEFDQQDNLTGIQNSSRISVNVSDTNTQNEDLAEDFATQEDHPPMDADPETILQWGLEKNDWDFLKNYFENLADRNYGSDNFWALFSLIPDQDKTYSLRMDILDLLADKDYFGELELQTSLIFHLAQMLEKPGPKRDLAKAYELYETIVDINPFSKYADQSELRMDYLERHYFIVR